MSKAKSKKCRSCGCEFMPFMTTQVACSVECASKIGKKKRRKDLNEIDKKEAKLSREKKLSIQPLSFFHKKAQGAFNAYIRARDAGLPCISCGRLTGCKMNAGHYRTVGASKETRYDESNCHSQCEHCNSYLSGNIQNYTPALIEKIGIESYEKLIGYHEPVKWTRESIEEVASYYRKKARDSQNK